MQGSHGARLVLPARRARRRIWDGGIDRKNASQVANSAYQSFLRSKYLAGSPILLNVGLGANAIWGRDAVWGSGAYSALTVVDKLGVDRTVRRRILDAVVRTIEGSEHKFWLTGVAVGFPRLFGSDFGLEAHAAFAMPFSFNSLRDTVGHALGGVVVIPWDFWKED